MALALVVSLASWLYWLGRIALNQYGRVWLSSPISAGAEREIRETHPQLLTVASIVVAALALGSLETAYRSLLIVAFACLATAWALAWAFGSNFTRYVSDVLLWLGVLALTGAVAQSAGELAAQGAIAVALVSCTVVSWWQGRAHLRSSIDEHK